MFLKRLVFFYGLIVIFYLPSSVVYGDELSAPQPVPSVTPAPSASTPQPELPPHPAPLISPPQAPSPSAPPVNPPAAPAGQPEMSPSVPSRPPTVPLHPETNAKRVLPVVQPPLLQGESIEEFKSHFHLPGYVRNETAYRIYRPAAFTKILNIISLYPSYEFGPTASLGGRIRGFYDAVYDLEDIDTISIRKGPDVILTQNQDPLLPPPIFPPDNVRQAEIRKYGVELRELYLDLHYPALDIRAGRQIVRWGVVEGSRVLDTINPLDFREYILRDVEDRYIPLWMLKTDAYFKDIRLETLIIPDLAFNQPAPPGTEWEQFQFIGNVENPPVTLGNTQLGLQLSFPFLGWDSTLSYFYTWDQFPVVYRQVQNLNVFGVAPVVVFSPQYTRLRVYGASATRNVGKLVVSGEAAYVTGKYFGLQFGQTPQGPFLIGNGETQKDYIKYAFELEREVYGTTISVEFLQDYVLQYDPALIQLQYDTVWGIFLRREWLHGSLVSQMLTLYFVNRIEWIFRPKLTYRVTDNVLISFGGDLLYGEISDLSGEGEAIPGEFHFVGYFRNNSRVYVELSYNF